MRSAIVTLILALFAGTCARGVEADANTILKRLTLEQKIGQLLAMGYPGLRLTPEMDRLISTGEVGGFILQVGDNFMQPPECGRLVNDLQRVAMTGPVAVPLFISMDQEGGVAAPISYMFGAICTPGNMALGAANREADAYAAYRALGLDMRVCGVNVNYAPDIDVLRNWRNPDYTIRNFGSDAGRIVTCARGAVRGLQSAGVIACAKHWPGMAYYDEDTHSAIARVKMTDRELRSIDFANFRAAIKAGADMIMTHHVYWDAWDPEHPGTLSPKVVEGILRGELRYDGVVVTDSMGMRPISSFGAAGETTVLAVAAGCDIVLQVSRDVEELRSRGAALLAAVHSGRLAEARIDQSVRRILSAKLKYGLFRDPYAKPEQFGRQPGRAALVAANRKAALDGIVVVRDQQHLLPLAKSAKRVLVISPPQVIARPGKPSGWDVPIGGTLGAAVRKVLPDAAEVLVGTIPTPEEAEKALAAARTADLVIGHSLLASQSPKQVEFIRQLLALGKPTVILGLGAPTDMALFPEVGTFVAVNSPTPICMDAATAVLFGQAKPGGTLPMAIGDLYPVGFAGIKR